MTLHEERLLLTNLAPWESGSPADEGDWSLFDEVLEIGDVEDRHTLSETFKRWELLKVWNTSLTTLG